MSEAKRNEEVELQLEPQKKETKSRKINLKLEPYVDDLINDDEEEKTQPIEPKMPPIMPEPPHGYEEKPSHKKPGTVLSLFNMLWNPKNSEVHFSRGLTLVLFGMVLINFGLYFMNAFNTNYLALFELIKLIPSIMGQPSELLQMFASIMADSFMSGGNTFNVLNWVSLTMTFTFGLDILLIALYSIRRLKNPFGKDTWSYGVARLFVPSLCFLAAFILSTFFGGYLLSVILAVLGCFMLGYNVASTIDINFYYLELPLIFACILAIVFGVFYITARTVNFDITLAIQQALDALQTLMAMYGM